MSAIGKVRELAMTAMTDGQRIGFDTSISFCEKLAVAYAMRGDQSATTAVQECVNGLKSLRDQCTGDEER